VLLVLLVLLLVTCNPASICDYTSALLPECSIAFQDSLMHVILPQRGTYQR